jgi:hypothetical protein
MPAKRPSAYLNIWDIFLTHTDINSNTRQPVLPLKLDGFFTEKEIHDYISNYKPKE